MSAYSLENPRPKPRSSLSGPPRPLVRSTSQIIAQNHIALSRQHSFDHGFSSTSGSLEPLAKRQKVEPRHVGAVSSRYENSPSNATAALVPSSRLERSRSTKIHEDSKIVASGSNIDIPPFPSRPGRLATKSPATSLSKANPTTKASVQGKPYTIEPPKFAPRYGNGGKIVAQHEPLQIADASKTEQIFTRGLETISKMSSTNIRSKPVTMTRVLSFRMSQELREILFGPVSSINLVCKYSPHCLCPLSSSVNEMVL